MKKTGLLGVAIAVVAGVILAGCMLHKTTTVTQNPDGGFTTNVVVTVDTNNLALDAAVLQASTAVSVSILVQKDASLIQPLKDAQVALDGILNGSNPETTQQVLEKLKAVGNPALSSEITSLIGTASALEQKLLAKYGVTVAGQISIAVMRAMDGGLIVGLAGH